MGRQSPFCTAATVTYCSLVVLAGGCAETTESGDPTYVGQLEQEIINGTPDTAHPAVVAVLGNNSACSGTVIHTAGNIGHVITAAHCGTPVQVRQGNDYADPDYVYPVMSFEVHPNYTSAPDNDFMIVRIASVGPSTPSIPAMTPAQDNLSPGTAIRHVGYGKAGPAPGSANTVRREFVSDIWHTQAGTFNYHQYTGGVCSGDSGGPQLTLGTERVAGITSTSDVNCNIIGTSGRLSTVYDSFIMNYINNTPIPTLSCNQCQFYALNGQGACVATLETCLADSACTTLSDCIDECTNATCRQMCMIQHAAGLSLYADITECICDTACVSECENASSCDDSSSSSSSTSSSSSGVGGGAAGGGQPIGGAGGTGTTSGGDPNNGTDDQNTQGSATDSSCTTAAPGRSAGHSLWLLALGLAAPAGLRRWHAVLS